VVFCEHEAVKNAGYQDPNILYFLARHNLIKMQALSFYLATQTFDDVETRIFFHLANLARTQGKKVNEDYYLIKEPLTHQLIADIVGSTRVRVTQIMKELINQNVLKKTGKYYIINLGDNCRKTYFK
jgi:CRP-like cAMP-binding protein